ncbi:MAG: bifunctional serine/threonine-protein kinase/formylglycine-generating enzyme family protein [Candidatus Eremiobacteraeota bacterium]|nr:bifunctional serine/threonine-protein kinase/formylglycine-generating enzyme family protein [Candidatus Eremiobacteraeota bacterium]
MNCSHCGSENLEMSKYCAECGILMREANLPAGSLLDHGRYEVQRLLKSGGMGAVYLVVDKRLDTRCALKEMIDFSPTPDERKKAVERFENEVKILSRISHPQIPKVTNYFIEGGHYYMILDYIEGEDLDSILKGEGKPGLPEPFVRFLGKEVLTVLEYLHGRTPPVLNRDIKPSNLMISPDRTKVYLIDFGIAKAIAYSSYKKTAIGTEGYAPLEQYRGYPEPRSDLYALGATMYQLIAGKELKPLDFPPLRTVCPDASPGLEKVLEKALSLMPEGRFAGAAEMKKAIEGTLEEPAQGDEGSSEKARATDKKAPPPTMKGRVIKGPSSRPLDFPDEKPEGKRIFVLKDNVATPSRDTRIPAAPEGGTQESIWFTPIEKLIRGPSAGSPRKRSSRHPETVRGRDKVEMVLVPAGDFLMGTHIDDRYATTASRDELPAHIVSIADFYIDRYPVTNRQFALFVEETAYKTTSELRGDIECWQTYYSSETADHPVVLVSWFDAEEYAAWAGKRLPTEAEWEKAARSDDGRIWPWGDDRCEKMANCREEECGGTTSIFRYEKGMSPYGICDMAGNVRQWTNDWYRPYPYHGPYSTGYLKVIRGSSFAERLEDSRCAKRWENAPSHRDILKGFRCAANTGTI